MICHSGPENGEIVGTNGDQRVRVISFCGMRRKLKLPSFVTGQANPSLAMVAYSSVLASTNGSAVDLGR